MRVFFTVNNIDKNNIKIQEKENIDALDIVTTKFKINIRISGIKIDDLEHGFTIYDETLNLE